MDNDSGLPTNVGSNGGLGLVERLRLIAAWDTPGGPTPNVKPDKMATCNEAADRVIDLTREVELLRTALKFYADGDHFYLSDASAWDTVRGEPQNLWCDEAGTATVEDGSIARMTLSGETLDKECDDGDELLRLLDLDPATYRTEGGRLNLLKIRAALAERKTPNDQVQP